MRYIGLLFISTTFLAFAASTEQVNLLCKGERTSILVPSLNGPDVQNIVLTKENGKVVKAHILEFNSTYTLKKLNTRAGSSEPPQYNHLIIEADRIIMRNISSDGSVLDAIVHNSGVFNANVGISRVVGQCETKRKLF